MAESGPQVTIITQNIDGLHQKAGSSKVFELHGSIVKIKCTECNFNEEIFTEFTKFPPLCKCGGILRPDVVWFGEALPQDVWQQAIIHANSCDVMVIAGTSLVVSPANTLPIYAKQNNATLIEINPDQTITTSDMDFSIRSSSTISLPELVSIFK